MNLSVAAALVQIALPAFIALVALVITIRIQKGQAEVARNRLKFDLFEKRYEFLQLIRNISAISLSNDGRYFDRVQREYGKFRQHMLLFPTEIGKLVDDFVRVCDELWVSSESLKSEPGGTGELERSQRENGELRKQIRQKMVKLERAIEDFIRVDWKG